ncbi:MAG: DNA polymerase III subunit delta' [Deltaproteobacteria bacterium HGW-Deltaproteobacteria-19]|jgi:DNA polymerase-3 subunit delta'|nr:MAG: DNA polymerase III subunit delta' [Deltaproteobacteria bacterium HGW-Deltaproteobacteria-19]
MPFRDICGHEKPISILRRALTSGRIAHAYLFRGMDGVGKRAVAETFAKALNCSRMEDDACGECPSCRKFDSGNHPDVVIIRPVGPFIRIGEVRTLQDQMGFRPLEGGRRVFLILEADRMNEPAANALLKTLEEPSPRNHLILVTSRPHRLPSTILSRCQHLPFNPLQTEAIALFLREHMDFSEAQAATLASSAGGSIGRALEMAREDDIRIRDGIMDAVAETLQNRTAPPRPILLASLGKDREEVLRRLDMVRLFLRDLLVWKETERRDLLLYGDRLGLIGPLSEALSGRELIARLDAVNRTRRAVEQNANRPLALEAMVLQWAGAA